MLKNQYKNYSNLNQKISLEAKKGKLMRVKKGLYTDDLKMDAPIIANICYGPSYLSFEYALSYYDMIPEYVSVYTSALFGKKDKKTYRCNGTSFEYGLIPNKAFPVGVTTLKNEKGVAYKIARKEKALCDTLYKKYPVRSIKDLKIMLFDDLRIDENEFLSLDFCLIEKIAPLYNSNTLSTLLRYIKEFDNDAN